MDERAQFQTVLSEFYRRLSLDPVCRAVLKKINAGTADFSDTAAFSGRASELLGEVFGASVLDMDEETRETVCMALLKERYGEMNDILEDVQTALDEPLGIHLTPQKAPFPAERAQQLAHSLLDPGAKPETIQRRANSGVSNVAKSFHDDFIKTNAKKRNDLGLKPIIQRISSGKACPWCLEVSGKFRFGDQPDGIFRRHDNCNCTIIYDTQVLRGKSDGSGGRSKTWEEVDPDKVMAEAWKPVRFSQEEARAFEENALSRLTLAGERDILNIDTAFHKDGDDPMFEAFGRAEDSNPKELAELQERLSKIGVSFVRHDDEEAALAYQNKRVGEPGTISVTPNASYSAWLHEAEHAFDDEKAGWNACVAAFDVDEHIRREENAYQKEIDLALSLGRPDLAERLRDNLRQEIHDIRERDEQYAKAFELYGND